MVDLDLSRFLDYICLRASGSFDLGICLRAKNSSISSWCIKDQE